jgi:hypothetical protein
MKWKSNKKANERDKMLDKPTSTIKKELYLTFIL